MRPAAATVYTSAGFGLADAVLRETVLETFVEHCKYLWNTGDKYLWNTGDKYLWNTTLGRN